MAKRRLVGKSWRRRFPEKRVEKIVRRRKKKKVFGFGDRVVVVVVLFDVVDAVVVVVVYFPKADLRSSSVSTNMKMPVMMAMEPRAYEDISFALVS